MKSEDPCPHSALVNLWALRLLRHSLTAPAAGFPRPKPAVAEGPGEIDSLLAKLGAKHHASRRTRAPRHPAQVQVAEEVAHLLGTTFDPLEPQAWTKLRRRVEDGVRRAEHALEGKPPLAAIAPETQASVAALGQLLALGEDERVGLAFLLLLATEERLERAAGTLGHDLDDQAADRAIAAATALTPEAVARVFASGGRLAGCQLIKRDSSSQGLRAKFDFCSRHFAREMRQSHFDPIRALRDRVVPAPAPQLRWDQFGHLGELRDLALAYCRGALEQRRPGVNLLLHGVPGCGKTEFTRALARELGCELYEVSTEDGDGDPVTGAARLQALRVAQEFTARRRAMVVFDEVEDAVPRQPALVFGAPGRSQPAKGWINRTLEHNPTVSVWATNAVEALDPAFVRRFDVVIELRPPPAHVRAEQFRALPGALSPQLVARLSACEQVTPAIASRAATVAQAAAAGTPDADVSRHVELLVNQTLRAQGHAPLRAAPAVPAVYDPRLIRCDTDPVALVEGLRRARAGRVCFHGPPGTGKTALAQHIARELGLRLLERRVSDLLHPFVGMTEQRIAAAFAEAEESGAALLIDEADSFLQDRSRAQRGWEVTQVNEFLTQLERFSGLFLASTNLIEGLDPASLRRFDLKLRFDYLGAEQAVALLASHLRAAELPAATRAEEARLGALAVLTPGDFAAVARQHRFRPLLSPVSWVEALEAECRLKPGQARPPIGFGRAA